MLKPVDQNFKKYCVSSDGSFLKKVRSIGGGGAAVMYMGLFIAVAAILLVFVSGDVLGSGAMAVVIATAVAGLTLGIVGAMLSRKRLATYLEYFSSISGYSPAELQEFDREVQESNCRYDSMDKKLGKNSAAFSWVVTKNWFKPINSGPVRIQDLAAAFYVGELHYNRINYVQTLIMVDTKGKLSGVQGWSYNREDTDNFVKELAKLNPELITSRKFRFNDREYDIGVNPEEAVALYCSIKNDNV